MRDRHDPRGRLLHGRFVLHAVLRSDGDGTVWSALDERTGDTARVTVLRADRGTVHRDGPAHARRMLAGARSPALVVVLDASAPNEVDHWIATTAPEGRTLDALLEDGALGPQAAATAVADVAEALAVLHRLGIAHGGVRPSSVLVRADGSACLLDAATAIAARPSRAAHATRRRRPVPTAALQAADVGALGVLLAAALSGQHGPEAVDPAAPAGLLADVAAIEPEQPGAAAAVAVALRQAAEDPAAVRRLAPPLAVATGPVPLPPASVVVPQVRPGRAAALAVGAAAVAVGGFLFVQLSVADPGTPPAGDGVTMQPAGPSSSASASTSAVPEPSVSGTGSTPGASATTPAPRPSTARSSGNAADTGTGTGSGSGTGAGAGERSRPSSSPSATKRSAKPHPTRTKRPVPVRTRPPSPAPTTPAPTATPTPAPTKTPPPSSPAPTPTTAPPSSPAPTATPTPTSPPSSTPAPTSPPASTPPSSSPPSSTPAPSTTPPEEPSPSRSPTTAPDPVPSTSSSPPDG